MTRSTRSRERWQELRDAALATIMAGFYPPRR